MSLWSRIYERINWKDEPIEETPLSARNLNKIDSALYEIDGRVVELSGYESVVIDYSNQAKTSAQNALSSETKAKTSEQNAYTYEQSALTSKNQAEVFKNEAETHANNASASERNAKLSEDNASASELLAKNSEENASYFATSASRSSENASGFAESAKTSAQNAKNSEDIAVASASSAKTDSDLAKSYTVGTHGEVRENDDTDNAKYYYEQTKNFVSGRVTGIKGEAEKEFRDGNVIITKGNIGLGSVPNVATNDQTPTYNVSIEIAELKSGEKLSVAFGKIAKAISTLISHLSNKSNPHVVTKSQVGLGNCDNTSDANKPVSTATQNALNLKANKSDLSSHTGNTSNPHRVTKAQVGLGSVPNVATNDQKPTYSEATILETLKSGEKMSVSFGKIMKAITELIGVKKTVSGIIGSDEYNSSKSYVVGEMCISNNKAYECILACKGVEPPNITYWKEVNLSSLNSNLTQLETNKQNKLTFKTSEAFSAQQTVSSGAVGAFTINFTDIPSNAVITGIVGFDAIYGSNTHISINVVSVTNNVGRMEVWNPTGNILNIKCKMKVIYIA